jgi:hypothetical protein
VRINQVKQGKVLFYPSVIEPEASDLCVLCEKLEREQISFPVRWPSLQRSDTLFCIEPVMTCPLLNDLQECWSSTYRYGRDWRLITSCNVEIQICRQRLIGGAVLVARTSSRRETNRTRGYVRVVFLQPDRQVDYAERRWQ